MTTFDRENQEPSLLSLFREELVKPIGVLSSELEIADKGLSLEQVNAMVRALRTIRGAAHIVGLPLPVALVHAVEGSLAPIRLIGGCLPPAQIAHIKEAVKIFQALQDQNDPGIPCWISDQTETINRIAGALRQAAGRGESPDAEGEKEALMPPLLFPQAEIGCTDATQAHPIPADEEAPVAVPREIPHPENVPGSILEKLHHKDHMLDLAGECLMLARKLRELGPSLRAAIAGDSVGLTEGTMRSAEENANPALEALAVFERFSRLLEELESQLYEAMLAARTVPFADRVADIPGETGDLSEKLGKMVQFSLEGGTTAVDPLVADKLRRLLRQLVRWIVIHSLETPVEREAAGKPPGGLLSMSVTTKDGLLYVTLSDDGRGMLEGDLKQFPGIDDVAGRAAPSTGSDTIRSLVESLGGSIQWEGGPGDGTRLILAIPAVSFDTNCFLVSIGGESYALPMARIDYFAKVPAGDVHKQDGRRFFPLGRENVTLGDAGQILYMTETPPSEDDLSVVVMKRGLHTFGLLVQSFQGEERLVLQPLDPRLGKVPFVRAAAVLAKGSPTLVLDVDDLLDTMELQIGAGVTAQPENLKKAGADQPG
jgi:two-component system sensor histidine kinase and response regulator WspE